MALRRFYDFVNDNWPRDTEIKVGSLYDQLSRLQDYRDLLRYLEGKVDEDALKLWLYLSYLGIPRNVGINTSDPLFFDPDALHSSASLLDNLIGNTNIHHWLRTLKTNKELSIKKTTKKSKQTHFPIPTFTIDNGMFLLSIDNLFENFGSLADGNSLSVINSSAIHFLNNLSKFTNKIGDYVSKLNLYDLYESNNLYYIEISNETANIKFTVDNEPDTNILGVKINLSGMYVILLISSLLNQEDNTISIFKSNIDTEIFKSIISEIGTAFTQIKDSIKRFSAYIDSFIKVILDQSRILLQLPYLPSIIPIKDLPIYFFEYLHKKLGVVYAAYLDNIPVVNKQFNLQLTHLTEFIWEPKNMLPDLFRSPAVLDNINGSIFLNLIHFKKYHEIPLYYLFNKLIKNSKKQSLTHPIAIFAIIQSDSEYGSYKTVNEYFYGQIDLPEGRSLVILAEPEFRRLTEDQIEDLKIVSGLAPVRIPITAPIITAFEKAVLIGKRAKYIALGADSTLDKVPEDEIDVLNIAEMEFNEGVLPMKLIRSLPDGTIEEYDPNTFYPIKPVF